MPGVNRLFNTVARLTSRVLQSHAHQEVSRMIELLGWMVFGLIVGAIAKLVMPGRDPGGIIVTMLLGVAGAMIGGFLGRTLGWYGPNQAAGFLMSLLGAIVLLALYRVLFARRTV